MSGKIWIDFANVKFSENATEKIFKSFLTKLSELHEMADRNVLAFIAAPTCAGKTLLTKFLEKISRENIQFAKIRTFSLDDFQESGEIDIDKLQTEIREIRQESDEDIILLEGNYLLLKNHHWLNIRSLADYSVFIKADENILHERFIAKKISEGFTQEDAENFFNQNIKPDIENVLKNSASGNETWQLQPDGDFILLEEDDEDIFENEL